jgi:hypothetical protein
MSTQLKYKMNDYQVTPPRAAWDAIANELDEWHSSAKLAKKMTAYEVVPPVAVWQRIFANLEQSAPVKRILSSKTLSWLSAAAIFGFLLMGSYYFLNKSDQGKNNTTGAPSLINADLEKQALNENSSDKKSTLITNTPARLALAVRYGSRMKKYNTVEDVKMLHLTNVEEVELININKAKIDISARPILNAKGEMIQDMSVVNPGNNKYVNITAPNGEQTKISSKLATVMHYFGNDGDDDPATSSNDWQQRIKEWRKKVMESGVVPSSTNFMDILELTKLIENN